MRGDARTELTVALVRALLNPVDHARPSVVEVLAHPWVRTPLTITADEFASVQRVVAAVTAGFPPWWTQLQSAGS